VGGEIVISWSQAHAVLKPRPFMKCSSLRMGKGGRGAWAYRDVRLSGIDAVDGSSTGAAEVGCQAPAFEHGRNHLWLGPSIGFFKGWGNLLRWGLAYGEG
jgi:hypothetical protein